MRPIIIVGMIAGIVAGATLRSVELGAPSLLCIPRGVTREQELRVVVRYIDERPEQMHLWFSVLAYDALKAAWPCKP